MLSEAYLGVKVELVRARSKATTLVAGAEEAEVRS